VELNLMVDALLHLVQAIRDALIEMIRVITLFVLTVDVRNVQEMETLSALPLLNVLQGNIVKPRLVHPWVLKMREYVMQEHAPQGTTTAKTMTSQRYAVQRLTCV
jgi:hypothetical protein